nr:elongation of very long chain fatty acids protein AAEL008004-like [Megalopta genalis]XP_033335361.1 elongation of very long chain fatty acids protein AAEL008004-like [Megalopta genalis]
MSGIIETYKDYMYNKYDPRTVDWFLMRHPGPLLVILASYLYFSTSAGPRYMRDKKPYDLKYVMIVYNIGQVIISVYLFSEALNSGWLYEYSYTCQPIDYSDNPLALRMAQAVHMYFMTKLVELLDTLFFVLRKKNRQISALHLFHHTLMPICAWVGCRWLPNGHGTFLGLLNTFVHVVMYSYYLLAAMGPSMDKYLWWKKYLTIMQLIQFALVFLHNVQIFFNGCNYPKGIVALLSLNALIFFWMFGTFYYENYVKDKPKRLAQRNSEKSDRNGNSRSKNKSNKTNDKTE